VYRKLQEAINKLQDSKSFEIIENIRRKQKIFNSEMKIGEEIKKIKENSHLVMNDDRMFIKEIQQVISDEYFQVIFDNGEFIHYDYYGKAYLSLNPNSKLYRLRLSRYDIKKII